MKEKKLWVNEFEGLAVTVELEGDVDVYAKSFLHIVNNVRESPQLLKVENNRSNDVTVYCKEKTKEALIDYLEWFGKIKKIEKVLMYQLQDADNYDFDKYEDVVVVPYFE